MTRVMPDNSARYFLTTTIWARKSTDRSNVEGVAGEDDEIELRRRAEQPVELRQRIMQVCNDEAAHLNQSECSGIRQREPRARKKIRIGKNF